MKRFSTLIIFCAIAVLALGQPYDSRSLRNLRAELSQKNAVWQMGKTKKGSNGVTYKMPSAANTKVEFMGNLIWDDAWGISNPQYGLYRFNDFTPQLDCIYNDPMGFMYCEYGGCVIDDYYYHVITWTNSRGYTYRCMYVFNLTTMEWDVEKSYLDVNSKVDFTQLSWTNTPYDKKTGLAYGYFYGNDGENLVLGSIDYKQVKGVYGLHPNRIAVANRTFMVLAIDDRDGQLYGIDSEGCLYRIDKTNGNLSLVGATGLLPNFLHQAADIDINSGKLYWTFIDRNMNSGLASVNIADAKTTICYEYDRLVQFGDFFVVDEVMDGAPAGVSELSWKSHPGDFNKVDVSFVMPELTHSGSPLSQEMIQYSIMMGDCTLLKGKAAPGQQVEVTLDNLPIEQVTHIAVRADNNVGEGVVDYMDVWAGHDYLAAPEDVTLEVDGNKATISWSAVNTSAHGGFADLSNVEYHVYLMRLDGKQEVAVTSYCDCSIDIDTNGFGIILLGVGASGSNGAWQSDVAWADKVQIGTTALPPLAFSFCDSCLVEAWWQTVDANGDGLSWVFDKKNACMTMAAPVEEAFEGQNDDWLVSVPIYLEEGMEYALSLDGCFDNTQVRVKNENSDEWTLVMEAKRTGDALLDGSVVDYFIPSVSGVYRFAICETGTRQGVRLKGFSISDGMLLAAPKMVDNLVVTPAPLGEKKVTISFVAPSMSVAEYPIHNISYIEVARDGQVVTSLHNIVPAQKVALIDEVKVSGMYKYSVRAISEYGIGEWSEASAYVGLDVPVKPQDVYMEDLGGSYAIHWSTPNVGEHGGYVNVDSVRHFVYDVVDGRPSVLLDVVEQGDSYVGEADLNGAPGWLHRAVSAVYPVEKEQQPVVPDGAINIFDGDNPNTVLGNVINDGSEVLANGTFALFDLEEGEYVESEAVFVSLIKGTPVGMPFAESFAGKAIGASEFWWSKKIEGSSEWTLSDLSSDNDGGSMAFSPKQLGDKAVVGTRKISLKGSSSPMLKFWYYANNADGGKLSVEVDRGQRKNSVSRVQAISLDDVNADGEWHFAVVDLSAYKNDEYIIVSFVAENMPRGAKVAFDNVSIVENFPGDLAVTVEAPGGTYVGQETVISVVVENLEYNDDNRPSMPFTVRLKASYVENGVQVDSILIEEEEDGLMPNGAQKRYEARFTSTPFTSGIILLKAEVVLEDDPDVGNNVAVVTMAAMQNAVPAIDNLTATVNRDMVTLNWTTPYYASGSYEIGYKVYVDGTCVQTIDGMSDSAVIGPLDDGYHGIYVTVLYGTERVESPLSNLASVVTAIRQLPLASVSNLNDLDVTVYSVNGSVIADGVGAIARLPRGMYVVKVKSTGTVVTMSKY